MNAVPLRSTGPESQIQSSPRIQSEIENRFVPDPNSQIKYLGLVIEKDEERLIEIEGDIYLHPPPDPV